MAYQDYFETVQRLYIAYYQRPADPAGLVYWAKALDWAGNDQSKFYAVVDAFANSAEATALYGALDTAGRINAIYNAAFGRPAESEGLTYWTNAITQGWTTIGRVLWEIVKPGSPSMNDAVTLSNKLTSAMNFTKVIDPELDGLNLLATYSGDADAAAARTWLAGVTNNPATVKDTGAAREFILNSIANPGDAILQGTSGTTKVLTTAIDVIEGTNFDDLFIGDNTNAFLETVQAGDTLNGLGGKDTLRLFGFTKAAVTIPNISNIEVIDVVGNAKTVNVSANADVNTLIYRDMTIKATATANLTVNTGQTIELRNIKNIGTKNFTININGAPGVKTVDVVVNGLNENDISANLTIPGNIFLNFATALTTVNLTASVASSDLSLTGLNAGDKVNIKGDQNITLTATAAPNGVFINASGNTGVVTLRLVNTGYSPWADNRLIGVDRIEIWSAAGQAVNLSNQTEAFTVVGGKGNDVIKGGASDDNLSGGGGNDIIFGGTGADTINGGGGNDTIWGGEGADVLTGGLGVDRFVFTHFSTADKIVDFDKAAGERLYIDLAPLATGTNAVGKAKIGTNFVRVLFNAAGKVSAIKGIAATTTGAAQALNNVVAYTTTMLTMTAMAQSIKLFTGSKLSNLISNVLAAANAAGGGKNDNVIAFGGTTVGNKLYIIYLTDANIGTAAGAMLATFKTIATIGAAFGNAEVFVF